MDAKFRSFVPNKIQKEAVRMYVRGAKIHHAVTRRNDYLLTENKTLAAIGTRTDIKSPEIRPTVERKCGTRKRYRERDSREIKGEGKQNRELKGNVGYTKYEESLQTASSIL